MIRALEADDLAWDCTGQVRAEIDELVRARAPKSAFDIILRLRQAYRDDRLVAVYLHALETARTDVAELCARAATDRKAHYQLGAHRFAQPGPAFRFVDDLDEVLAPEEDPVAHVTDSPLRPVIESMLGELGRGFSAFIENQHEVPGPNARVRQGIVRSWYLPDGTRVASKRANPLKPGRFEREQRTVRRLAGLGPIDVGRSRKAKVAPPLATVRADGRVYAISCWVPGESLETALLDRNDHREVLRHYRDLMDALLDHGVLWGDLSPRNVLRDGDVFHLVDFEKSVLLDRPITAEERVLYCRGQVGVEELGVLCSPQDVKWCLRGYFDPDAWDLNSASPLPFPQRPEVADVLRGRGVPQPSLGQYNRTDTEIFDVRSPEDDPTTGGWRYPGLVNFRVEHYLSCAGRTDAGDFDRKTTEVLIAGRVHGCFEEVMRAVEENVDEVERLFVLAEFRDLLEGRTDGVITAPTVAIDRLVGRIDALYEARGDAGLLKGALQ